MSLRRIAIFVAFLISTTQAIQLLSEDPIFYDAPETLLENSDVSYRLPDDVVPSNYEIELTVKDLDGKDFSFTGTSIIDINVIKKVSAIVLHAQNLTINSKITLLSSTEPNKTLQDAEDHSIDTTTNFLTIKFKSAIEIGKYKLSLSYAGVINDQLRGFHQGYYTDQSGVKKWIASTHFEPVGARLAFPCWDEPALKANFTISINHDEDYTALSNMKYKLRGPTAVDNQVKTTFEPTPKMSTYLVAFAVVNFDSLSNEDDKSLKVWAKKNSVELRKYAVDVGLKALKALEAYTKINYKDHGFKKMDFIALPQFAAGAMENWGLVTYREKRLLYDEKLSSLYDKEGVAKVIAHELAHQWFGNLVSPKWWQYVWLNEGFAAYFEYVITNEVETKWRLMERFVVETIQNTAFVADSLNTSHVMDVIVESPKEISSIFDSITYSKAASVIRMISHIVSENKFKTALNTYLTNNKFNVATSENLFAEINKVTETNNQTPLKTALTKWATTPGYPVVNIIRDYKNKKANITQFRFLINQNETDSKKYWIPLNFASQADLKFDLSTVFTWFDGDKSNVIVDAPTENHWLICNLQQFGYYRVNYDEQNWKLITQYLLSNHSGIHLLNRAQLIDDALNLARANYLKYKIAFDLIKYLKQETDFIPWSSAWNGLSYLNRLLTNTQLSSDFREFVTSLTESSIKSVSFEESSKDEHIIKLHRMKLIENTCRMGLKSCIDYASQKFSLWLSDSEKNPLSKDTKSLIICNGVRNADNTTWNKLLSKYEENNDDDILTGLGCSSNKGLLNSYLKMAINDSFLGGSRDKVFKAVYEGSDFGVDVTLDFLNNNIHDLLVSNTASAQNVKTYISDIGSKVTKKEQIAKIELIKKQDTSLKVGIIDDGLEKAQANVDWLELRYAEIQEYFKKPDPTPSTNQPGSGTVFTASLILLTSTIVFTVFH